MRLQFLYPVFKLPCPTIKPLVNSDYALQRRTLAVDYVSHVKASAFQLVENVGGHLRQLLVIGVGEQRNRKCT